MPRPSLKAARTEEILDAYERCVAVYGIDGTTLEQVADEAQLARALIRHNIGNKDALLDTFLDRFIERSDQASDKLFAALPDENRIATMIDWLFVTGYSDPRRVNLTNALLMAAHDRPQLAKRLSSWTSDFVDSIREQLCTEFPDQSDRQLDATATGIAAIYFNYESSVIIDPGSSFLESSKQAATNLVSALTK